MLIREIMSTPAVTCRATVTLDTAARLMWENDHGALPVTDDAGVLVGMVTDRDLCMAAYLRARPLGAIPVASAMAREVVWCRAEDPVELVAQLMHEREVRRIPVLDRDNRPIGVLSRRDLERRDAAPGLDPQDPGDVARALTQLGEPSASARPGAPAHLPTRAPPGQSRMIGR